MSSSENTSELTIDRYTTMGEIAQRVQAVVNRGFWPTMTLLILGIAWIAYHEQIVAALSFALISLGCGVALAVWRHKGIGLPLLPMFALQQLIAYGLPLITGHEIVREYSDEYVARAGLEVCVFLGCLAGSWRLGMQVFSPSPPVCYALHALARRGLEGLSRTGFYLIIASTGFILLQGVGLTDFVYTLLPAGSSSIVTALLAAVSTCGFFLASISIGKTETPFWRKAVFVGLLIANFLISSSSLLLSGSAVVIGSVVVGLFWGTGRIPWLWIAIMLLALSFLNLGKYPMRDRYWTPEGDNGATVALAEMPARYSEWTQASVDVLLAPPDNGSAWSKPQVQTSYSLSERVNNLGNLLFVIDAMDAQKIPPLYGETYALIPPLLVPRILWPDKPRTHEGQVLLAVHFGRQELSATFTTYIAWGLLPEAYGNFGPLAGSIILGVFLGLIFAWIENATVRKTVLSVEGFVGFAFFLSMASSFELVSSTLVTSQFQAMVPIIAACAPFARHMVVKRPPPESLQP